MTNEEVVLQKEPEKSGVVFLIKENIFTVILAIIVIIILGFISLTHWAVVDQPFLGGLFNTPILGFPLYIFFFPISIILFILAYIFWVKMKWGMMTPFHGLWIAMNAGDEVVFKTDLHLNFVLKSEYGARVIFDRDRYNAIAVDNTWRNRIRKLIRPGDPAVSIAKILQGDWDTAPIVNIGSVPASILLDANGWTKDDSKEHALIANECDLWNDMNESDQVHSLQKAWRYMNEGKIPVPKGVNLYVSIPWIRVDNAYPKSRNAASWGGFIRQIAENIQNGAYKEGFSMTWAGVVVFLVSIGISGMMFVMKILSHTPVK
jgi:uncharacterized membrane protein